MTSIETEALTVIIHPVGAEIHSVKNKNGLEYIWQADPAVWPRHAPVLFPIVGKLKDNKFLYPGGDFELGQHGFARDLEFRLLENDRTSCTFQLTSTAATKKNYPFDFDFRITYTLAGNKLTTRYSVINTGAAELLFSVGAHPGFRCPLHPSEKYEDYFLEFESEHLSITKLNNGLRLAAKETISVPGKKLPLSTKLFDQDALVFEDSQINKVSLRSGRSENYIEMESHNWPYFGIWSKKGNREFVCLEPWYGIADIVNTDRQIKGKEGIISLDSGKEFNCSFSIVFA